MNLFVLNYISLKLSGLVYPTKVSIFMSNQKFYFYKITPSQIFILIVFTLVLNKYADMRKFLVTETTNEVR